MASIEVERLSLEVPGLPPEQGRRLAEMVAKRLAEARLTPAQSIDRVNVAVTAPGGGSNLDQLAGLIADGIRRGMA